MNRTLLVAAAASLLVTAPAHAQATAHAAAIPTDGPGAASGPATPGRAASANAANVFRAERPPVIDGRDDDAAWAEAEVMTQFREFQPRVDAEPRFRTEAKVTYDDRYLYAFVRAFDPRPDSILPLLSRRDVRSASDQLKLIVDSYHDERSAYQFAVNPAGVKRDYTIVNDVEEDGSWDGVWDVATRIDSLGWTAEYRIPLSQLRFAKKDVHTFGFGVWRDVQRTGERYSWPLYDRTKHGVVSQLGEIRGITGLGTPRRLEVLPYTVSKSATRATGWNAAGIENEWSSRSEISGGADVKYGLTSNLTLDATINPDFGQVEADPAQVNLNSAEQSLPERRPFFVEGSGVLRFDINCNDGNCSGLFYSRRIGRAPQLGGMYGDEETPTTSTILGAAKLTGRLQNGLSIGILNAVTQRELGARSEAGDHQTVEPFTNYFAARLSQDLRGGKSGIGLMATAVNRDTDEHTRSYLREAAYTGGVDFRHRFWGDRYRLDGFVAFSHVQGDSAAIRRTQQSYVHNYQRPDDDLEFDPTRTALTGDAQLISFGKTNGTRMFNVTYRRISPGFEINDLGYLQRADEQLAAGWFGIRTTQPRGIYRQANLNFNHWSTWTTGGLHTNWGGNVNGWVEFKNQWSTFYGVGVSQLPGTYNDRSAQGGRAVRRSPFVNGWLGFNGDRRGAVVPYFFTSLGVGDEGQSVHFSVSPSMELRAGSRFSMEIGPNFFRMVDHSQQYFFGGPEEFATIDYRQMGIGTRLNFTATRDLSVQMYAEPFVAAIDFSDLRRVGDPDARRFEDRYVPVATASEPIDQTIKQLRMNTVLRWEYRPGSTLFLVWSQDRDEYFNSMAPSEAGLPTAGRFELGRDYGRLFRAHPKNTFLIKASYWLSL